LLVVYTVPLGPVTNSEYAVGELEKLQLNVPPSARELSPVSDIRTGTAPAAATAGPTCVELASVDVPAELVAVAKALKKFGTSID
jgi:hypothetical protein